MGGEGSDPGGGGLLGPFFQGGGGGHCRIGATGADGVEVTRQKLGDAGVATASEEGGLPGIRVGLSKCRWVAVPNIVQGVNPWEVGIEGGAIICGDNRGGGLFLGLSAAGAGGWGTTE